MKGLHNFILLCTFGIVIHTSYAEPCDTSVTYPIADPYNCSNFYVCESDQIQHLSCPPGFYFSPVLLICTDDNLDCVLATTFSPTEEPTDAPTKTTTRNPTTLEPTDPTTQEPTDPTTQEPTSHAPTDPTDSGNSTDTWEPTGTTDAGNLTSTLLPTDPTTTEPGNSTGCPGEVVCRPGVQYIPHSTDCTKFYECDNGIPVLFQCPDGLYFHPIWLVCTYPGSVIDCELLVGNCTSHEDVTHPASEVDCTENPPGLFPDPPDCSRFYECADGQKHTYYCPHGLHFNPQTGDCDWPDFAGCQTKSDRLDEEIVNNGEEPSGEEELSGEESEEEQSNGGGFPNDPACSASGNFRIPHPEDCNKYLECHDGTKFVRDCPPGLHFNPELEVCDWPHSAGC